ncbi:hypothetical protein BJ508DRAFT_331429 [Ascobolus immersus RN42]|uniref:Uncharacterized protein n=1 Tax=Ascobolus immersus RN42 TaxID=1160509 RepID=A0A3N4I2Q9_ASCIM|nr:hypothetical protein BJ508DRAFT_331429 [Ascobolus immersus RN42]
MSTNNLPDNPIASTLRLIPSTQAKEGLFSALRDAVSTRFNVLSEQKRQSILQLKLWTSTTTALGYSSLYRIYQVTMKKRQRKQNKHTKILLREREKVKEHQTQLLEYINSREAQLLKANVPASEVDKFTSRLRKYHARIGKTIANPLRFRTAPVWLVLPNGERPRYGPDVCLKWKMARADVAHAVLHERLQKAQVLMQKAYDYNKAAVEKGTKQSNI